jgi:hypothetical protein
MADSNPTEGKPEEEQQQQVKLSQLHFLAAFS